MFSFKPSNVCASQITFDIQDGLVKNLRFYGSCPGNSRAISQLCENMAIDEVINRLEGIKCNLYTSCPDQLTKALKQYKESHENQENLENAN